MTGKGQEKKGINKKREQKNGRGQRREKNKQLQTRTGSTETQEGGKGELLGGWAEAALVSRLPQVVSHCIRFLVELPSMDTFLSHD